MGESYKTKELAMKQLFDRIKDWGKRNTGKHYVTAGIERDIVYQIEIMLKEVEARIRKEALIEEAIAVTRAEARVENETAEKIKIWVKQRDRMLSAGRAKETGYTWEHYDNLFLSEVKKK